MKVPKILVICALLFFCLGTTTLSSALAADSEIFSGKAYLNNVLISQTGYRVDAYNDADEKLAEGTPINPANGAYSVMVTESPKISTGQKVHFWLVKDGTRLAEADESPYQPFSPAFPPTTTSLNLHFMVEAKLVSIDVTPKDITIDVSATAEYTAIGTYDDASTKNITNEVLWSSSNTAAATINSSGLATGVSEGQTTISAAEDDITGSTELTVKNPFPVELFGFSATSNGHIVTLNWSTATEKENYGFDVQRKNQSDGDWKKIGSVMGNGTTAIPHKYSFVDDHISVGAYSYRLKQIDFDGCFEFTDEILIEVKPPGSFSLDQNYPNPFNPATAINFSIKQAGKVSLKIYNLQGQLIRSLVDEDKPVGSHSIIWNGTNDQGTRVSGGTYLYTLKVNGFEETKKLTYLK